MSKTSKKLYPPDPSGSKFSNKLSDLGTSLNNCTNPLKLKWTGSEYKVNKPLDQCGSYVSKEIADALLKALLVLRKQCKQAKLPIPTQIDDAISEARIPMFPS